MCPEKRERPPSFLRTKAQIGIQKVVALGYMMNSHATGISVKPEKILAVRELLSIACEWPSNIGRPLERKRYAA